MSSHKYLTREKKNGRWVYTYKSDKSPVNDRNHSDYLNTYAVNDHNHNIDRDAEIREEARKLKKKYKNIFGRSSKGPVNK